MQKAIKIEPTLLGKLSVKVLELIEKQIEEGIDIDGKKYEYSTKPFARPIKGIPYFKSFAKRAEKSGRLKQFTAKSGSLWAVFTGGYREYRELTKRDPDGDFLNYKGEMLAAMTSTPQGDSSVVVGFSSRKAAEKAFWLNVSGVGKSRKLWKFLGLTKENERILVDYAKDLIVQSVELKRAVVGAFKFQ